MDPGDYVITFNGGLVQETATGKELIKDLLDYEGLSRYRVSC